MFSLLLLLVGIAVIAAQVLAAAQRRAPIGTEEAILLAAFGLAWMRHRKVKARNGRRALLCGILLRLLRSGLYLVGREHGMEEFTPGPGLGFGHGT